MYLTRFGTCNCKRKDARKSENSNPMTKTNPIQPITKQTNDINVEEKKRTEIKSIRHHKTEDLKKVCEEYTEKIYART